MRERDRDSIIRETYNEIQTAIIAFHESEDLAYVGMAMDALHDLWETAQEFGLKIDAVIN